MTDPLAVIWAVMAVCDFSDIEAPGATVILWIGCGRRGWFGGDGARADRDWYRSVR